MDSYVVSNLLPLHTLLQRIPLYACHFTGGQGYLKVEEVGQGQVHLQFYRYFQSALPPLFQWEYLFCCRLAHRLLLANRMCYSGNYNVVAEYRFKLIFSVMGFIFSFMLISLTILCPIFSIRVLAFFFLLVYYEWQVVFLSFSLSFDFPYGCFF